MQTKVKDKVQRNIFAIKTVQGFKVDSQTISNQTMMKIANNISDSDRITQLKSDYFDKSRQSFSKVKARNIREILKETAIKRASPSH
jgi:hypothetical protein